MKTRYFRIISVVMVISALCFHSCQEDTLYPLANFKVQGERFLPGCKFNLDATESISLLKANVDSLNELQYRWDLNGDHIWGDTPWLFSPILTVYDPDLKFRRFIGLQVKDQEGNSTEVYRQIDSKYLSSGYGISYRDMNGYVLECINYKDCNQIWTPENILNPFVENDKIDSSYYFSWGNANSKMSDLLILPSLHDWEFMIDRCGGAYLAGFNMSVDVDHGLKLSYKGFYNGTNVSEFDKSGYYWTATELDENNAYAIKITKGVDKVEIVSMPKNAELSVRLFQNYSNSQTN